MTWWWVMRQELHWYWKKYPSFQLIHILINVYLYYENFRTHALQCGYNCDNDNDNGRILVCSSDISLTFAAHTSELWFPCFVYFHPQFCAAIGVCKSQISWCFTHRSMDSVLMTRGLYSHLRQLPLIPRYHTQTPSIIPLVWCYCWFVQIKI